MRRFRHSSVRAAGRPSRGMCAALIGGILLAGVGAPAGCAQDIRVAHPAVRFESPRGAVLYVTRGGRVTRVRFGTGRRASPVVCAATRALLDVRRRGAGRRWVLHQFASRPGFARVQLHDAQGRLIARGRMCIFPTLEPLSRAVLGGYTVSIPAAAMARLRAGRPVALYQSYRPADPPPEPWWHHVAWVLYLDPRQ